MVITQAAQIPPTRSSGFIIVQYPLMIWSVAVSTPAIRLHNLKLPKESREKSNLPILAHVLGGAHWALVLNLLASSKTLGTCSAAFPSRSAGSHVTAGEGGEW